MLHSILSSILVLAALYVGFMMPGVPTVVAMLCALSAMVLAIAFDRARAVDAAKRA